MDVSDLFFFIAIFSTLLFIYLSGALIWLFASGQHRYYNIGFNFYFLYLLCLSYMIVYFGNHFSLYGV